MECNQSHCAKQQVAELFMLSCSAGQANFTMK